MKNKVLIFVITVMAVSAIWLISCDRAVNTNYMALIEQGEFTKARQSINFILANDTALTSLDKYNLLFEIERLARIEKDFTKNRADVIDFIKEYIPEVSDSNLTHWENDKSLEVMVIDGQKHYFNNAARNLFRINKECKAIWDKKHNYDETKDSTEAKLVFNEANQKIIDYFHRTGGKYSSPQKYTIDYKITVKPDVVPNGEIIRCWIPYPREIQDRQTNIKLIETNPAFNLIAPNDLTYQRTIYMEKPAVSGQPTEFAVKYEYTAYGMYVDVIPEIVQPVNPNSELKYYLEERPPHIIFDDKIKELSKQIVGDETNPYCIAQKLFQWVDDNAPWASAREYSTIRNLYEYPIINHHGDCGIQTMLFMTLCRYNGIPTRWQSGWVFEPSGYDNMHDWGMIYFEPYGWLPMDVTYGVLQTDSEELKWFYVHGMDSGRLIFNDDIADEFYPKKIYPRSETVDSQRGEVEWKGGNLYFDQWDYELKYELNNM